MDLAVFPSLLGCRPVVGWVAVTQMCSYTSRIRWVHFSGILELAPGIWYRVVL